MCKGIGITLKARIRYPKTPTALPWGFFRKRVQTHGSAVGVQKRRGRLSLRHGAPSHDSNPKGPVSHRSGLVVVHVHRRLDVVDPQLLRPRRFPIAAVASGSAGAVVPRPVVSCEGPPHPWWIMAE